MKNTKRTSVTLTAAAVLGLSLVAADTQAQGWRGGYNDGYGRSAHQSRGSWGGRDSFHSSRSRDSLRNDVLAVDRLAQQMNMEFSRTIRYNHRCRESIALLNHLRTYSRSTQNLVRAYNGTCKVTFKKAACDVREILNCVERQAKRVPNLSCSMKSALDQSCPLATRIHKNADRFNPVSMTRTPPRGHTPHGHSHGSRSDYNPYVSLFGGLIRAAINR